MDTRSAILDAAQDLMQSRGANGMSYEDVSNLVGIRKASIHYHFASKSDLVAAVVERYAERFDEAVVQILAAKQSGAGQLRAFAGLFRSTLADQPGSICLCGMLASEVATLDSASRERIQQFFDRGSRSLEKILIRGVEDGSLRLAEQTDRTAAMLFAALEGALLAARLDGRVERFDALLNPLLGLLETTIH